jgi:hypothetical protein
MVLRAHTRISPGGRTIGPLVAAVQRRSLTSSTSSSVFGSMQGIVHRPRETPCGLEGWLLWCCTGECSLPGGLEGCLWWEALCSRELDCYTQAKNMEQLRDGCSECIFTVYCGCCDNILEWITCDLKMLSVRKHMIACTMLFVHLL